MYDWRCALAGQRRDPPQDIKEVLLSNQVSKSTKFREHYLFYQRLPAKDRTYDRLVELVDAHVDHVRREKMRAERSRGSHSGPVLVTTKGVCRAFVKAGSCPRGMDACPYEHPPHSRARARAVARARAPRVKGELGNPLAYPLVTPRVSRHFARPQAVPLSHARRVCEGQGSRISSSAGLPALFVT